MIHIKPELNRNYQTYLYWVLLKDYFLFSFPHLYNKFLYPISTDTIPVEIAGRVQVLDNGDLLIAAVKPNDAGKYTCIRANEAGSVNGSGFLTVMGNY